MPRSKTGKPRPKGSFGLSNVQHVPVGDDFNVFFADNHIKLMGMAASYAGGDHYLAGELFHRTMITCWRKWHIVDKPRAMAWVVSTMRLLAMNIHRLRSDDVKQLEYLEIDRAPLPDEAFHYAHLVRLVRHQVRNEFEREFCAGATGADVAPAHGSTRQNCNILRRRFVARVKKVVDEIDGDPLQW